MRKPIEPPPLSELIQEGLGAKPDPGAVVNLFRNASTPVPDGKYRHWDTLRHLKPPAGLTSRQWWLAVKLARIPLYRPIPLKDSSGQAFKYMLPDVAYQMLHEIDKRATGTIKTSDAEPVVNPQTRDSYLVRSLMEEAIRSSQLEGAATTRRIAKEMLRTGRPPRTRGEQMIANNYRAMQHIIHRSQVPLSPSLVYELHSILTAKTPPDDGGLRLEEDDIVVEDGTGVVLHVPPPAKELPHRIQAMCDFTNHRNDKSFMHPVTRAIFLHFWLAYDHPFTDGNGRTARALFYWSMARDGYWLIEFISISRILRAAPAKYARAFLYTETDDNDLTYFILNQLKVITRAIDDMYSYLSRKTKEISETREILAQAGPLKGLFNHRQLGLIRHALAHPGFAYTIRSHKESHGVSYQTARTDLISLGRLGLLELGKIGRSFAFDAPPDLQARLERLKHRRPSRRMRQSPSRARAT